MKFQNISINRRTFLKSGGASLALSVIGPYALDITLKTVPWRVALIGCGWCGTSDLLRMIQVANIQVVGLCDADRHQVEKTALKVMSAQELKQPPPIYRNYQRLLTQESPEIVIVATPDHWHALQTIDALKSGAHVYLQKPVSHDILEGEAMLSVARRYNRIVQVGLQGRNTPHLIDAKKRIIDEGLLGRISHVEMCCYYHMRANATPPVQRIPEFFDYEFWTGPAPYRPFDRMPHRGWWRAFMQYSNGIIGDMGVPMLDTVRWLLGLEWPEKIYSTGGIFVQKESKANTPDTQTAIFKFGEIECVWRHRSWGLAPDPEYPWGFFIYGEKGILKGSVFKYEFVPYDNSESLTMDALIEKDEFPEDLVDPEIELHAAPATRRHMLDFLKCIETKSLPEASLLEGHISTASCLLANLSIMSESALSYDPKLKFIEGNEDADQLIQSTYREPWIHPYS